MKTTHTSQLIFMLMILTYPSFAHNKHLDKTIKKDSVVIEQIAIQHDTSIMSQKAQNEELEINYTFPNYHPLIVHFPIVLLIIATLVQLFSFFIFKKELSWVALILLALGVIVTWLSSNTFHAHPHELTGSSKEIFEIHEQMAMFTWWFSLAALSAKIISQLFLKRKLWLEIMATALLLTSAVTVSIAGHHGAMLVHIEGIGPKGNHLESHEQHHNE